MVRIVKVCFHGEAFTSLLLPANLVNSMQESDKFCLEWAKNIAEELNGINQDVDWVFEPNEVYDSLIAAKEEEEVAHHGV